MQITYPMEMVRYFNSSNRFLDKRSKPNIYPALSGGKNNFPKDNSKINSSLQAVVRIVNTYGPYQSQWPRFVEF